MSHLKREMAPKFWPIKRKAEIYATHIIPGPHMLKESMPLRVLVRDALGMATTAREADRIIKTGAVSVDGKARKEPKFPVGLMDIIELGGKTYRMVPDVNGYSIIEIKKADAGRKPCKILSKTTIRGGVTQLNLHDGRNVLVKTGSYKPGDTVIIEIPKQKILEHIKFKEGENAIIIDGKNRGFVGKIKEIRERKTMTEVASTILEGDAGAVTTPKEYVMVGSFEEPPRFASRIASIKPKKAKEKKK